MYIWNAYRKSLYTIFFPIPILCCGVVVVVVGVMVVGKWWWIHFNTQDTIYKSSYQVKWYVVNVFLWLYTGSVMWICWFGRIYMVDYCGCCRQCMLESVSTLGTWKWVQRVVVLKQNDSFVDVLRLTICIMLSNYRTNISFSCI